MTLKTRPVRLSLLSLLSAPLAGAKINAQLSLATPDAVIVPSYEIDSSDVVPLVVTFTEDAAKPGDYLADLWPNTRGTKGTRWLINVAAGELLMKSLNLTVIDGSALTEVMLRVMVDAAPYPQVFPSSKIVSVAQGYANAAGESASIAVEKANQAIELAENLGDIDAAAGYAVAANDAKLVAVAAKVVAEAARDLSQTYALTGATAAKFADSIAAGRTAAGMADGITFGVKAGGLDGLLRPTLFRRDSAATQTEIVAQVKGVEMDALTAVVKTADATNQVKLEGLADPLLVFSALGPDGLLYNLLAFLPDGSIDSPGVDALVTAKLGGQTFGQITAPDWGAFVYTQLGPDGLLYVLAGMLADGSFYAPGVAVSGALGELLHILFLGQSNAAADQAQPIISTTVTGWGSYRFARGVATWSATDNAATPAGRAAAGFALSPLTASGVETRANGLADAYKSRLANASRYSAKDQTASPHILTSFSGLGSRRLTELGPVNDGGTDPANTRGFPGGALGHDAR